jgi:hypothetical protein
MNDDIINYIESTVDNNHTSLARLLHKLYHNNYCVTTDNNKDKWFRFNENHWESSNAIKHELKNKLSSDVALLIGYTRSKLREKIMSTEDNLKISWEKDRIIKLLMIEKNLYNTHFKDGIIKECESIFYLEKLPEVKRA